MAISTDLIIYVVVFIAVLLLVEGIYLTVFGKSISLNSRVNRRFEMLEKGGNREEVLNQLRKEMGQHLKSRQVPLYSILAEKAQKANIAFSPVQLIGIMALLAMISFVGLTVGTATSAPLRAGVALGMGVTAVFVWINNKAKKRMSMIEEQLPEAVELMVRSLRVGHPFSSALTIVSKEVPDPLGTEMGVIADESAYGRDVGEALKDMAERLDMQDMRFLAVAVSIQQQSGGNLAEVLEGLSKVIRSRFKLFRRVKAITAESKWSGMFLSLFPLGCLLVILVGKPDYYDTVKHTAAFIPACLVVAGFLVANIFIMRSLVDIKV
ncbi:type II secretion system F family protein [Pacificibacter marinus]|uniref:type II secretion system F family protein n=1 Tax=Pacificibacter marinus TaxID=658057 RepID=UPI001C06CC90|nr:type II secretion system F family protein [Pacificibacter marinus]MBU2865579.1 type II secretion system F family protein [Pacificibacter marinus]